MLQVDADFPGGNIMVDGIDGTRIRVHQDVRDTFTDWFWFYFRVRGAAGQTIAVEFTKSAIVGVRGPAVSIDGGASWFWLGGDAVTENRAFSYAVPPAAGDVRFAFGIPYLETNLNAFLGKIPAANLKRGELCRTPKGRSAELLRAGRVDGKASRRVLITARHHCCESTPDFSIEGLIARVLDDSQSGRWLRENVEFVIVPFMDKDGVEAGDQGKNRKPHDHNRDYAPEDGIYAEVRALKALAASFDRIDLGFDLHCPWIRGKHNEEIYFVGCRDQERWARITEFSRVLEKSCQGPLPYKAEDDLPFGQSWNTHSGPQMTCARFISTLPGCNFAASVEIPYANVRGVEVTPEAARAFGRDLADAVAAYFQQKG